MDDFKAKLLLFGEYTIIQGSSALAMPLVRYSGRWQFAEDERQISYPIEEFVQYLMRLADKGELLIEMDLRRFEREVNQGLYFASDIPIGYGVGSSGALCAATYQRFAIQPLAKTDESHFVRLKQQLAQLEGYFHGASSGTDPLICYLGQTVLLLPNGQARLAVPPPKSASGKGGFFLLDTGISRKTAPLVEKFLFLGEQASFSEAIQRVLVPATEKAICCYLAGRRSDLLSEFRQISSFQYQYFQEMIPGFFKEEWKKGLDSEQFYLKLCGAGGGGFLLGYCEDVEKARATISKGKFILLEKI